MSQPSLQTLSVDIEALLTRTNPRGMALVRGALEPGYVLRAAQQLLACSGNILIATGFPVADTFETDGPAGAIALYQALESRGVTPWLLAGASTVAALSGDFRCKLINRVDDFNPENGAEQLIDRLRPSCIIAIERPGAAVDGRFYNIRGVDISERCRPFEPYIQAASCPFIAIGDGGNEIGMGKAGPILEQLDIRPAAQGCDELIAADVSNWGAYALVAMMDTIDTRPALSELNPSQLLVDLVAAGAVDGVTHRAEATEDGLAPGSGELLVDALRDLTQHFEQQSRQP